MKGWKFIVVDDKKVACEVKNLRHLIGIVWNNLKFWPRKKLFEDLNSSDKSKSSHSPSSITLMLDSTSKVNYRLLCIQGTSTSDTQGLSTVVREKNEKQKKIRKLLKMSTANKNHVIYRWAWWKFSLLSRSQNSKLEAQTTDNIEGEISNLSTNHK